MERREWRKENRKEKEWRKESGESREKKAIKEIVENEKRDERARS